MQKECSAQDSCQHLIDLAFLVSRSRSRLHIVSHFRR